MNGELDVETLAEALTIVCLDNVRLSGTNHHQNDHHTEAVRLAAEYARLIDVKDEIDKRIPERLGK